MVKKLLKLGANCQPCQIMISHVKVYKIALARFGFLCLKGKSQDGFRVTNVMNEDVKMP